MAPRKGNPTVTETAPVAETAVAETNGAAETPKRRRASGPRKGPTVVVGVSLIDASGAQVDTKGLKVKVASVSRDVNGFAMDVINGNVPEGLHFILEIPAAASENDGE